MTFPTVEMAKKARCRAKYMMGTYKDKIRHFTENADPEGRKKYYEQCLEYMEVLDNIAKLYIRHAENK